MNRKLKWIASILLACGLFACKHGKDSGQKQEPTKPEITLSIQAGSDKVSEAALQGGVPYTISNVLQAAGKKLSITPALKNATNATEEIKAEITEPASTPPLTVTKNASGVFELGFTNVTESTPVKIKFYTETTNLEKIISFTLLPEPVINDFELAETSGAFGIGAKQKIKVTPIYSDAKKYFGLSAQELNVVTPKPAFSFTSDNNAVVEVDSNGLFTTKVQGSAKITVTLGTIPPVAKDYTVTVENVTAPNELLVQNATSTVQNAFNLKVGDNVTIKLVANPTNGSLILQNGFSCDNTSIAKIAPVSGTTDKYTITALKNGTANFSAISKYNSELKINIKVTVSSEVLTGLTVTPNQKTLTVGETFQLSVTAAPASASNSVTWASNNSEAVSVDEYGLVTVRKEDAAPVVITARSKVDDTKKAISIIKVAKKAESISLDKTLLESLVGEKPTFTATVSPADASQEVKWTLSDTNLASLNTASGTNVELTCKKTGTLKLTATAVSNPEAKAEATVYIVNEKVTGIVFYDEKGEKITTVQDLVTNTNDNVFYFAIEPKEYYSSSSANQGYTLECSSTNITINESEPSSYLYTKKLTISVGNLEKTDTVTITSKVNPLKKAVLSIKAATKKVTSIEVPNKTVFLGESGAKMTATVTPKQALQTVKWSCDNPSVAYVDENSGEITPVGKGTATVTATAQDGSGITGSGTLTIREAITNYTVNWTSTNITYYGKEGITFKVTPNPADGYANFTATCDNTDVSIKKEDDFTFSVTVRNKEAKTATSTITVKAGGTSIADKTLSVSVKSNEIASIDTSFYTATWKKMYKNETKTVPLSAFIADSGHPDMSLLDIKIMSGTRDKTWYFDTASLAEGTLKIEQGYEYIFDNEERLTVKVTKKSGANLGSVELTIYDNVAEIRYVSCRSTETTIGDEYKPRVSVTLVEMQNVYKKFAITENSYMYGIPTSDNLEKAVYERDSRLEAVITLTPKAHTEGVPKTFYVFPIDPKTGEAVTNDTSKTFRLTIWEKATGIELSGGNFDIIKLQSGGYDIRLQNLVHNQPAGTYWFYAKIIPEYSKPVELNVEKLVNQGALKNIEWNLQSDGRTKISFGTYKSGIGVAEEDTLLIYLNDTIKTTLKVKIN